MRREHTVPEYGFFLSCEEYQPADLLRQAWMAEQAGFTRLAISDHYHPWTDAQGSSPFVWSMIGALSEATDLPVTTLVTCPTVRMHPAIVAQAAATSAVLLEGRFTLGLGTGEALNEHILGDRWPRHLERLEMLDEAVRVMRQLFSGRAVFHEGKHYTVRDAKLYTLPLQPPPVYVSAFGPKAAELAGRIGDGLITMKPNRQTIDVFRGAGGVGKPVIGGLKACVDSDRQRAVETVRRLWASEVLPGELGRVLPSMSHFEQASTLVGDEAVAKEFPCGDDPGVHLEAIDAYEKAGFDEIYIGSVGPRYEDFFEFYADRILPRAGAAAMAGSGAG